jgi:hypothetical protein
MIKRSISLARSGRGVVGGGGGGGGVEVVEVQVYE